MPGLACTLRWVLGLSSVGLLDACGTRSELLALEARLLNLELDCPTSPDDPRLQMLAAGEETWLDASLFTLGLPDKYAWSVVPEGCDAVSSHPSYDLENYGSSVARFVPGRPYGYRVRLDVSLYAGPSNSCEFDLPVQSRGLRVETCWTNDQEVDVDLFLHSPWNQEPFMIHGDHISDFGNPVRGPTMTEHSCNVHNCTPELRGHVPRVDFGYPDTPLEDCGSGPTPEAYRSLGICPNPRAAIDSNGQEPSGEQTRGFMEVVHIDAPRDAETFRIMLRNFNNLPTVPQLFIYCNGVRTALEAPAAPVGFVAPDPGEYGLMWRPVDIVTSLGQEGELSCMVHPLVHPDDDRAPYVTINRPIY